MLSNMELKVVLVLSIFMVVASAWVNQYDQTFSFYCPGGQSIRQVVSRHSNTFEDRQWAFSCQRTTGMGICKWTIYENEFDQPFTFQCPRNGVIRGMHSYHSNHYEDRRFRFYCCDLSGKTLGSCHFTGYLNAWDGYLNFNVPTEQVLRGVSSYHDNRKEDRRWKFSTCTVRNS